MNEQKGQQEAGASSNAPLWMAAVLVLAGVAGYYVLASQSGWLRWLSVAAGLVAGAVVFGLSAAGSDFRHFVADARNELRKVFWPTRNETWMTTLVVFGFAVIAGLFFFLLDSLLTWTTGFLTGHGG